MIEYAKKYPFSFLIRVLVYACSIFTIGVLAFLVGYILIKGVGYINLDLFAWDFTTSNQSMMPAIVNTLIMVVLVLLISAPLGVFSAIYLAEYAKRGNKFVYLVRLMSETLSGIPSIVFGLFGNLVFVIFFGFQYSLLAGALTLAIMVLPTIMVTSEEALNSVPDSYREGSFGLGAGKLRTIFRIVLPAAMPGILSGIVLSIGKIVGESAALIYTAGTLAKVYNGVFSAGRTLSTHMYALTSEGLYINEAFASAVVLLVIVIVINLVSERIARKIQGGQS